MRSTDCRAINTRRTRRSRRMLDERRHESSIIHDSQQRTNSYQANAGVRDQRTAETFVTK